MTAIKILEIITVVLFISVMTVCFAWSCIYFYDRFFKKKPKIQFTVNDNISPGMDFTCTAHGKPIKPKKEKRTGSFKIKVSKEQMERLNRIGKSMSTGFKVTYNSTKEKKTMTTREQALKRLKVKRAKVIDECGLAGKIEDCSPDSVFFRAYVGGIGGEFKNFVENHDPPLKAYPEGTTGYGDGNLTKIVNCKDNYYECSRQKTPGVYPVRVDNFEPLPIYAELEQYKKALKISCRQAKEWHDNLPVMRHDVRIDVDILQEYCLKRANE